MCGLDSELIKFKEDVLKSKNQVLISYFLIDNIISVDDYKSFITNYKESEWLQNYQYLLTYDKNKIDILLPENATKIKKKDSYKNFYEYNLGKDISILKPIGEVTNSINTYLKEKIDSYNGLNRRKN